MALPQLKLAGMFAGGWAAKAAMIIGAGAALAFGCGYAVARADAFVTAIDTRGYDRGVAELTVQRTADAETLRQEMQRAADAREREIEARRADAETRAREADRRASAAIRELMTNDPAFAACMALPYPDSVRRHFPREPGGLRVGAETPTADGADGRG